MLPHKSWTVLASLGLLWAAGADFRVPGTNYPAQVREEVSILPGGRALRPLGRQVLTGTGPFAIGVSPSGKTIVTANIGISPALGINRPSITVIVPGKHDSAWNLTDFAAESRQPRSQSWQGVARGLAVTGDNVAWVSEGDSGRVVEVNLSTGGRKGSISLNDEKYPSSFSDALVWDSSRNLLIVLDVANARACILDVRRIAVVASVKTGILPAALALSGDGKRLYVVNSGRPASLSIIDFSNPAAPTVTSEVALAGDASGVAVHNDEVYVSLAHEDTVAVVNGQTAKVEGAIPLRIPGLEDYRGITPLGLAFEAKSGRLLVAEAGINAVGVIDVASRKLVGHLPVGWFPNTIQVHNGEVYVTSARGFGTGPSAPAHRVRMLGGNKPLSFETDTSVLRRGSVSAFTVPSDKDLAHQTDVVMQAAGFVPLSNPAAGKPAPPVRYVVLIVKGDRSFDEILGDVDRAGDKVVLSEPTYARFGSNGYVSGGKKHFSLHVDVTPNHHELAARWAFADNFYADSDSSSAGRRWLAGAYPDLRSETGLLYHEAGNQAPGPSSKSGGLADHLARHSIDFRSFGEEVTDLRIPDQRRASQFIDTVRQDYLDAGKPLPRFLMVRLPNDEAGPPSDEGYPYEASYVADNDYALGRIVEFLAGTPWWKEMAIFVTESGAQGGADHIDSHRMLLLGAGPWFRTNYVSHSNTSAPALLRTIFRLLDVPPMSLYDATAGDLMDMFGAVPDFAGYQVKAEDPRLFDPELVK